MSDLRRRRHALLAVLVAALTVPTVPTAAAAADATTGARIVAERRISERVLELTVDSTAFDAPTGVMVNLPRGYERDTSTRWPVTYYLAGTNHTHRDFNEQYGGVELTQDFPSIVVAPNGDSGYWSDWFNGGTAGTPEYETFVVEQLLPLIDQRFRTTRARATRAVMGESMGGYGTLMLAARHPDLFSAAASLSGAVDSNLPANGAVLSASPALQGAEPDAIYGPRATQEIRWRGHNPADLAANLRTVAVQLRTGSGVVDPALGETAVDVPGCAVEAAVDMATSNVHAALQDLAVPHLYERYPTGCHSVPSFMRQIAPTLVELTAHFRRRTPTPTAFEHSTIETDADVFGWSVRSDGARALEFLRLRTDGRSTFTLAGSGRTDVTTPPLFRAGERVAVEGATPATAVADDLGRLRVQVDLGTPNSDQQFSPGVATPVTERTVRMTRLVTPPVATGPAAAGPVEPPSAREDLPATGPTSSVPLLAVVALALAAAVRSRRAR